MLLRGLRDGETLHGYSIFQYYVVSEAGKGFDPMGVGRACWCLLESCVELMWSLKCSFSVEERWLVVRDSESGEGLGILPDAPWSVSEGAALFRCSERWSIVSPYRDRRPRYSKRGEARLDRVSLLLP